MLGGERTPLQAARQRGVTLVELLIGIAILSVLLVVALPEFSTWIQNARIRTAAESVLSGMQLARNEAVRRNLNVQFAFGAGSTWTVSVPSTLEQIQTRSSAEGATENVTLTRTPGAATTITFNSLGRRTANADASPAIDQIVVDLPEAVLALSKSRELQITISPGGNVRMCDPNVTDTSDPRKC